MFSLSEEDLHKKILDIGTGEGDFIQYLRKEIGNKDAYGVDNNKTNIKPGAEGLIVADGLHLPFEDETFDLVTAKNYLHWLLDKENKSTEAISEVLRVLRKGGRFVATCVLTSRTQDVERSFTPEIGDEAKNIARKDKLAVKTREAGKLEQYLFLLRQNGYSVDLKDGPDGFNVITIEK